MLQRLEVGEATDHAERHVASLHVAPQVERLECRELGESAGVEVIETGLHERQSLEFFQTSDRLHGLAREVGVGRQVEIDEVGERVGDQLHGVVSDCRVGECERFQAGQAGERGDHLVVERPAVENLHLLEIGEPTSGIDDARRAGAQRHDTLPRHLDGGRVGRPHGKRRETYGSEREEHAKQTDVWHGSFPKR